MSSQYPAQPTYVAAPPNSPLAVISLVTGILSYLILPFIGPIIAVITGHLAKKEIKASNGTVGGNGMATAGLILGYINLGLFVLAVCVIAVLMLVSAQMGTIYSNIYTDIQ